MSYTVKNLGFVPNYATASRAYVVSALGTFMGYSTSATANVGFIGTQNNLVSLVPLLPTQTNSGIYASDKDGAIYGGFIVNAGKAFPFLSNADHLTDVTVPADAHAQIVSSVSPGGVDWTVMAGGGISSIGYGPPVPGGSSTQSYIHHDSIYWALTPDAGLPAGSYLYLSACSDNGIAVGSSNNAGLASTFKANLWNYNNASPIRLSPFAGDNAAIATTVSADGSIVGGFSYNSATLDYKPVIWLNTVVISLGLPTGYIQGWISNMSADGMFLTGALVDATGKSRAFVYNSVYGYTILDPLTNTSSLVSQANAYFISNDGRYVAGIAETDTVSIVAAGWVGGKLYDKIPAPIPQPIAMPCFENCLGKNSALTKIY
jgi:uncharacterized membrane protein